MEYTDPQLKQFETIVDKHSNELEVLTFVKPDAIVVADSKDSIRVSKGKKENQALVEADGKTNTIETTATDRTTAVEVALKEIRRNYDGDLHETSVSI